MTRIEYTSMKDLVAATKTLFTSPSYVFISIGIAMESFGVASSTAFLPKIIQVVYNMSPAKVSLLYGLAVVVPVFFGQVCGEYYSLKCL